MAIPYADWSSQTETCPLYGVGSSRLDSMMETGANITTEVSDRMLVLRQGGVPWQLRHALTGQRVRYSEVARFYILSSYFEGKMLLGEQIVVESKKKPSLDLNPQ